MTDTKAGGTALRCRGLRKNYGPVEAVRGLDLEARKGQVYGFLGRNGAGKTTTIRMILGLARSDAGEIGILGSSLAEDRAAVLARIGYLVEGAAAYPNLTVRENLELQRSLSLVPAGPRPRGLYGFSFGEPRTEAPSRAAVEEAIALLGLGPIAERRAGRLSLGNKQRLSIARALVHSPELLILDEPANGLDPAGIAEIRTLLRRLADEEGVTIFMSSHLLDEVEQLADRIGIIHEGRLAEEFDRGESRSEGRVSVELRPADAAAARAALAAAGIAPLGWRSVSEDLETRFMRSTGGAA